MGEGVSKCEGGHIVCKDKMSSWDLMLIHPRQREGPRVLEICYKERFIIGSTASGGDT